MRVRKVAGRTAAVCTVTANELSACGGITRMRTTKIRQSVGQRVGYFHCDSSKSEVKEREGGYDPRWVAVTIAECVCEATPILLKQPNHIIDDIQRAWVIETNELRTAASHPSPAFSIPPAILHVPRIDGPK